MVRINLERLRKTTKYLRMAGIPTKIQTGYLQNTNYSDAWCRELKQTVQYAEPTTELSRIPLFGKRKKKEHLKVPQIT
jgi:hypothetical protein